MSIFPATTVSSICAAVFLLFCASSCARSLQNDLEASNATLAYLESSYGRVDTPGLDAMLRRVSAKLSKARVGLMRYPEYKEIDVPRIRKMPWQVHVIADEEINAYAIGSGMLVLTKSMIQTLETEAQLAAVLAHEMSHELLGHTTEVLGSNLDWNSVMQHYDLEQEIAADGLSALLLHAAGYDPSASIRALVQVANYMPASEVQRFNKRIAALDKKVHLLPVKRPYFVNTREYNRVRRLL